MVEQQQESLARMNTIELSGIWDFGYQPEIDTRGVPALLAASQFTATMPVPAWWDDQIDRLRTTAVWPLTRFNPLHRPIAYPTCGNPPDATLPNLFGCGWYRTSFDLPAGATAGCVTLHVGGASVDLWCWLNGEYIGYHRGHATAFDLPLDRAARDGTNELILAASNLRTADSFGCDQRGQHAYSGGLHRPVSVHVTGPVRIASLYVRADDADPDGLVWRLEVTGPDGQAPAAGFEADWMLSTRDGKRLGSGVARLKGSLSEWKTGRFGMRPWSDRDPVLYEARVRVRVAGRDSDACAQPFGLRRMRQDGTRLLLNGTPVYLRGHCEHHYYPLTCTAPTDVETYRNNIRVLKGLGFNWLRFHTWIPSEEYMQAADELGMLIQVEPAPPCASRTEQEWLDIFRACRRHPSVVIYCGGNEEALDPPLIELLAQRAALLRQHVPDGLFNPMEALRGVEYFWAYAPMEEMIRSMPDPEGMALEPYPHHVGRLNRLKEFSDCFGQYSWAQLSYGSVHADIRMVEERLRDYERPCLTHELGILANFLDLDLEHRYTGTRIGPDLYTACRAHLSEKGLLDKARRYYRGSCLMMRTIRKHNVEAARKVTRLTGYDMLGATDQHWHRTGYPCGVLNEFFELKPGESESDVRRYNGESVLLECRDIPQAWNFYSGDTFRTGIRVSLFGPEPLAQGTLEWTLADESGCVRLRGDRKCAGIPNGAITPLGIVEVQLPTVESPATLVLTVRLTGGSYALDNAWRLYVFPRGQWSGVAAVAQDALADAWRPALPALRSWQDRAAAKDLPRVVTVLDGETLAFLHGGGDVLLLGHAPFASQEINFQGATTGRPTGHRGLLVNDHPALAGFPHSGGMEWQFFSMMEKGASVLFEDGRLPFDPIIEVIPCYKNILRQAAVFEMRVDQGRLLVCSLTMKPEDPAAAWLLGRFLDYMAGAAFQPRKAVTAEALAAYMGADTGLQALAGTDQALDPSVARRGKKDQTL